MIKNKNNQEGVSLILTIFVMAILLAVVLFIAMLLYTEVRNVKNLSDSVTAFFAADSGVEKVLYYDRNVLPEVEIDDGEEGTTSVTVSRGLCSMTDTCPEGSTSSDCNNITKEGANDRGEIYDYLMDNDLNPDDYSSGCNPEVCDACQVSFDTELNDKTYQTVAKVIPSADGLSTNFNIKSKGSFSRSSRRVEVHISSQYAPEAITIINACATPISVGQNEDILIQAEVYLNILDDSIDSVKAYIKNSSEPHNEDNTITTIDLCTYDATSCPRGDPNNSNRYVEYWSSTGIGSYYVDIEVSDTQEDSNGEPNTKIKTNIASYPACIGQ